MAEKAEKKTPPHTRIDAVMAELIEECHEAVEDGDIEQAHELLDAIEHRAQEWADAVPNVAVMGRRAG